MAFHYFLKLPDVCISVIFQYYTDELSVRNMAKFSCMSARLNRAIFSNGMRTIWPSLPPMCLCDPKICSWGCSNEKVPEVFCKKLLAICGAQSRKLNIHSQIMNSSDSSTVVVAAIKAALFVGDCRSTLEDLKLHLTVTSPAFVAKSSEDGIRLNELDKGETDNLKKAPGRYLKEDGSCPGSEGSGFANLSNLFLHIEYFRHDDDAASLFDSTAGAISVAILKTFGSKLRQLSICTSGQQNLDSGVMSPINYSKVWGEFAVGSNDLSLLCPLLRQLELFDFDIRMLSDQCVSKRAPVSDSLSNDGDVLEILNGDTAWTRSMGSERRQCSPLNLPFLDVLEVSSEFETLEEIESIFLMTAYSTTHIHIMGSTAIYLHDILSFLSSQKMQNLKNLVTLELHDSTPWPYCDEIDSVEASSILEVFAAYPSLTRIVVSTVFFSESALCSLLSNSIHVVQESVSFSSVVSRTNLL